MLQKILIFGFPHSGTTILKSILGHIPDIYEIIDETDGIKITDNINQKYAKYNYILAKFPFTKEKFITDEYKDYIRIFIMRNPVWVYSSLNKRFGAKSNGIKWNCPTAVITEYEKTLRYFDNLKENSTENIYTIRYEDMFENNFKNLKKILDDIGLIYNDDIFDNSKYTNLAWTGQMDVPNKEPDNKEHIQYRTYQINRPFKNMNDINKIDLDKYQINKIKNSQIIKKIYPNIHQLI